MPTDRGQILEIKKPHVLYFFFAFHCFAILCYSYHVCHIAILSNVNLMEKLRNLIFFQFFPFSVFFLDHMYHQVVAFLHHRRFVLFEALSVLRKRTCNTKFKARFGNFEVKV